jgi:high-affinity nickel permease
MPTSSAATGAAGSVEPVEKVVMSLAAILALGFFLGMRHATDADHVVAVSAIVTRERTLRAAATIGLLWGLGHTATIVLVGGAIVLFGRVISPRLGLGMELSVGVMLVLLGALNLRG